MIQNNLQGTSGNRKKKTKNEFECKKCGSIYTTLNELHIKIFKNGCKTKASVKCVLKLLPGDISIIVFLIAIVNSEYENPD